MSLSFTQYWPKLLEKIRIADELQNKVDDIAAELETFLKANLTRKICVHPFGSRVLGIAQETSDLDIYVEFDDSFYDYKKYTNWEDSERQKMISKVFDSQSKWICIENRGGNCPLVIIKNKHTNLQYDLSFTNCYAYSQNKIVIYLFKLQPIARYMMIYLRDWIKMHGLHLRFRNHLLLLMLIFHLQIRDELPSIEKLQENLSPRSGPYIYHFNELHQNEIPYAIPLTEYNVQAKLKEFFKFYSSFRFEKYAICPYLGRYIERSMLKLSMPKRYQMTDRDGKFTRFPVAIQDFINLNYNKAWQIRHMDLSKFINISASERVERIAHN
ncbi:PREDICTED: terminal uridylyltransferase Tailor-like [Drosophila arizonae]|uniref:Terminal uridylyltransferase Tailor-like n=1 Tax=Drosophila arizonae TaxID=7263 RepID=A0ABM1NMR5_DROAR|nr:PREDICTED: terminal uridylyltransferase Tailor-like [Drosophila arizonae]XP_017856251.1 PREDICTED: terminal uridylyltransferase Tailor-like [Drosophila arizonae]XP_017856252.1 PREDICTED: terminal uridylyltransferase Tailor-like [Drosophila arizonae]